MFAAIRDMAALGVIMRHNTQQAVYMFQPSCYNTTVVKEMRTQTSEYSMQLRISMNPACPNGKIKESSGKSGSIRPFPWWFSGFCAAAQVVRIRRQFTELSTGKQSDETDLAISSLMPLADPRANAESLIHFARGHWSIENGNHYVRDRTYDEDRCPVRCRSRERSSADSSAIGPARSCRS